MKKKDVAKVKKQTCNEKAKWLKTQRYTFCSIHYIKIKKTYVAGASTIDRLPRPSSGTCTLNGDLVSLPTLRALLVAAVLVSIVVAIAVAIVVVVWRIRVITAVLTGLLLTSAVALVALELATALASALTSLCIICSVCTGEGVGARCDRPRGSLSKVSFPETKI